jgi:hypothetical protein
LLKGRAVIGMAPFSKRWSLRIKWPPVYKMAALLFYHSPIFSLIMMKVGAEDQELGWSIGLLATSCWQGTLCGAGSSDSCGVLFGAFTVVFPGGLREVDICGGTTG